MTDGDNRHIPCCPACQVVISPNRHSLKLPSHIAPNPRACASNSIFWMQAPIDWWSLTSLHITRRSKKNAIQAGASSIVMLYLVSFTSSFHICSFRTMTSRQGWLFNPEGAHVPALIISSNYSRSTGLSVKCRMRMYRFLRGGSSNLLL
jgi:hypothetical protein